MSATVAQGRVTASHTAVLPQFTEGQNFFLGLELEETAGQNLDRFL